MSLTQASLSSQHVLATLLKALQDGEFGWAQPRRFHQNDPWQALVEDTGLHDPEPGTPYGSFRGPLSGVPHSSPGLPLPPSRKQFRLSGFNRFSRPSARTQAV